MNAEKKTTPNSMATFYHEHVHHHLFTHHLTSLIKYRKRILSELKILKINIDELKDKIVFDMGSGFQAIIFAELGCKHIFHIDINEYQVNWLKKYCLKNNIYNISSSCLNVRDEIDSLPEFDFAFLYGILHHLEDPASFLLALHKKGNLSSHILLRCYRSGTWSRWLVAHLRTLTSLTTLDTVRRVFCIQFPLERNQQFLSDMLDDLFTPVWKCFSPEQIKKDSKKLARHFYCPDKDFLFDFSSLDENFRCKLTDTGITDIYFDNNLLEISMDIDQVLMELPDSLTLDFHKTWQEFSCKLKEYSQVEVAMAITTIYRLSRRMDQKDYFQLNTVKPILKKDQDLGNIRIKALLNILQTLMRNLAESCD